MFPGPPKPERGYKKRSDGPQKPEQALKGTKKRNNGTKNGNEGTFAKPPFYKTTLNHPLFPLEMRDLRTSFSKRRHGIYLKVTK